MDEAETARCREVETFLQKHIGEDVEVDHDVVTYIASMLFDSIQNEEYDALDLAGTCTDFFPEFENIAPSVFGDWLNRMKKNAAIFENFQTETEKSPSPEGTFSKECKIIKELFPGCPDNEISSAFQEANSSVEEAVELLLSRSAKKSLSFNSDAQRDITKTSSTSAFDDPIKRKVLERYFLKEIDETRPVKEVKINSKTLFKTSKKSLIRYRDGVIVSRTGEKESEVKK
eukprot:Nk52_evm37s248 gene=Nk52_evmTU37s248